MFDDVAQVKAHAVVFQAPFKTGGTFADEVVPVEKDGSEVLAGDLGKIRMLGKAGFDLVLLPARQEKRESLFDRIHAELVDQLAAEAGKVELRAAHPGKLLRQAVTVVTEQREVVMAEVGMEGHLSGMLDPEAVQLIHGADMVVGEAGENLLFRIEDFRAGAVVGQAEADETVMDQTVDVGLERREQLVDRQVRRVEDIRDRRFPLADRLLVAVVLEDQEGFIDPLAAELVKKLRYFRRCRGNGEPVGIGRVFQQREGIAFPERFFQPAQFPVPEFNAERQFKRSLRQTFRLKC